MRRRAAAAAVLGVLAAACVLAPPSAALDIRCSDGGPGGSWTTVGGSLAGSRVQEQEHDVKAPLYPLWTFDPRRWSHVSGQQLTGQPLVDAGCVYVASHTGPGGQGWVYALSTGYGEAVWQQRVDGGVHAALALTRDLVLAHVQSPAGPTVVALDRRTGAVRWRTVVGTAGGKALASPVVVKDVVLVGVAGARGASVVLDLPTGRLLRSTPTAGVESSPAVDVRAMRAYLPTADGVVAVDLDRARGTFGRVVARGPRTATSVPPNLVAGRVTSLGDDGVLRLLRPTDLRALGQVLIGGPGEPGATAAQGTSVFGSSQTPGAVWSVDAATGSLRWLAPLADGDHRRTPVSLANGAVYTVDLLGDLVVVDAATGLVVWRLPMAVGSETYGAPSLSSTGVTIAEHLVLTASGRRDSAGQDGFLVAYGPAKVSL